MYILPVIPVLWFFETRGLRASMVLTGMATTIFSSDLLRVRDFSPSEQAKKALPSKVGTLDPYDPTLYNYVAHLWITICPSGEL